METNKITAVVVTYNRKKLLLECLNAILAQTYPIRQIILIDNASTDGTYEFIKEAGLLNTDMISYHRMDHNSGGAGGFCEGLRIAREMKNDWVWVMDDDTIPTPDALKTLIEANEKIDEDVSFLCSSVYGPEGEYMNVPTISQTTGENGYRDWYKQLKNKAVKVADATFVSVLINGKALQKCGLPCKDFFIWGDDTEYTMRIIKHYGPAYMIGDSEVIHKRFNAKRLSIKEENDPNRLKMYGYFFRNILTVRKLYGMVSFYTFFFGAIRTSIASLFTKYGFKKMFTIYKGIWSYFTQKTYFRNYIDQQLNGK